MTGWWILGVWAASGLVVFISGAVEALLDDDWLGFRGDWIWILIVSTLLGPIGLTIAAVYFGSAIYARWRARRDSAL